MGIKSFGTGVISLKFLANFMRSLILTALSAEARLRRLSWTFIFSVLANCLKESSNSVSTFSVAVLLGFTDLDAIGIGLAAMGAGLAAMDVGLAVAGAGLAETLGGLAAAVGGLGASNS
jgi:hypothetical protein